MCGKSRVHNYCDNIYCLLISPLSHGLRPISNNGVCFCCMRFTFLMKLVWNDTIQDFKYIEPLLLSMILKVSSIRVYIPSSIFFRVLYIEMFIIYLYCIRIIPYCYFSLNIIVHLLYKCLSSIS